MPLAAFILSLVKPVIGRILVALGISAVTITGFNISVNALKGYVISGIGGLSADVMNLFLLSGMGEGLGIIFGAITTRIIFMQATKAVRFVSANP